MYIDQTSGITVQRLSLTRATQCIKMCVFFIYYM